MNHLLKLKKKHFWKINQKFITETPIKKNEALGNINKKVLELMNDKGVIAPYLASSLVNFSNLKTKVNSNY